jgi:hypothetical protein
MADERREALLKEYGEVSSNFRLLTDIRFKLLAFLPIATAAAAALKGDTLTVGSFVLSLFGLAVTVGLATYNSRNDQLYNELVGRAAFIERSLAIPDGAFANRPRPWLNFRLLGRNWTIDHGNGISTIYTASILLWLFGVLAPLLEIGRRLYLRAGLPHFAVPDPPIYVQGAALVLTALIVYLTKRSMSDQRKGRSHEMRQLAAAAVERLLLTGPSKMADDGKLAALCAKLAGEKLDKMQARARFYATLSSQSLTNYLVPGSDLQEAAQLVALITDLPPGWIFDCATNRKGEVGGRAPSAAAQNISSESAA